MLRRGAADRGIRPLSPDVAEGIGPTLAPERGIAVLPFEALGSNQPTAFTHGIHSDVLTKLSRIAELRVISRTSVNQYQGTDKAVVQIGRELNVAWVVEGEVQEAGGQFRVHARLVNARTDRQAWAEGYSGELTPENLFQIQGEITRKIAAAVQARLTPEEQERVEHLPTQSLAAYRLYAQGRRGLDQRTEEGMREAMKYFEQALEEDPRYALAWAGLADALVLLHGYRGYGEAAEVLPRAEQAARRALELDERLAEAHASLGLLHSIRLDGPASIYALQRAVELWPNCAEAHNWLSWQWQLIGRPAEALESARHAVILDPLLPEAICNLSFSCLITGDLQRALHEARRLRQIEPGWATGAFYEALALYHLDRVDEALPLLRDLSVPWTGNGPASVLALGHIALDDVPSGRSLLSRLKRDGDPFARALVHAALEETDEAFEALRDTTDWRGWSSLALRFLFPDALGSLRSDPRFSHVMCTVNRAWKLTPDGAFPPA